jgi:hypothetical protein
VPGTVVDEHARGRGVNVSSYDVAENAAALRVEHDGVVHDRVVMLVVDQPVDARERGADVRLEQACPGGVRDLGSDVSATAAIRARLRPTPRAGLRWRWACGWPRSPGFARQPRPVGRAVLKSSLSTPEYWQSPKHWGSCYALGTSALNLERT